MRYLARFALVGDRHRTVNRPHVWVALTVAAASHSAFKSVQLIDHMGLLRTGMAPTEDAVQGH